MTVYVDSMDAAPGLELEVVSPELALVDPELVRAARALLPDPAQSAFTRLSARSSDVNVASVGRTAVELERPGERHSRRWLFGVAVATMLALLLFDVRVEVGERRAVADSNVSPVRVHQTRPAMPTPASASQPRARVPARTRAADRRFAWAPVQGASGYHVEFFRGATRVFAKQAARPLLTVPAVWTFEGTRRSLQPGTYRWYVWPIVGGARQSQAVVQTTVSIPSR